MPITKKPPSDAKAKQITDFFPRKSLSQTSTNYNVTSQSGAAKKTSSKQTVTPRLRSHTKEPQGNVDTSKFVGTPGSQRTGSGASSSTKTVQLSTSPTQPPTKRLRSQSIVSPQQTKQPKRSKNILYDCDYDRKMDVDDDSVVYVRSVPSVLSVTSPFPHATTIGTRESKVSETQGSSTRHREAAVFVPSSVSEERELGPGLLEKESDVVKEGIFLRQEKSLPSPATDANSRVQLRMQSECVSRVASNLAVDWDMDSGFTGVSSTPSRPTTATSLPTPPSTDEPAAVPSTSRKELPDEKERAEQIIKDIKLRARAFAQAQEAPSPVLEISSPITSDDDDDDDDVGGLTALNFRSNSKLRRCGGSLNTQNNSDRSILSSPVRPKRYSLRKSSEGMPSNKQKTSDPQCGSAPLTKRKSPTANPLDALLKEKRSTNAKNGIVLEDRESRLRALAYLDLNDDSEDDESSKNAAINMRMIKEDDGNPFMDDKQRQQVMDILADDRVIESEEEHARLLGNVGAKLWDASEARSISSSNDALPPIEYEGSDPSILMLAQAITDCDYTLLHMVMENGALEMANYAEEGENVIAYLLDLALSPRDDTLNLRACQSLSRIIPNFTAPVPIPLLDRVLALLRMLGAQSSVLERMGWMIRNDSRGVPDGHRSSVIEHLIVLIAETSRACCLSLKEIPDIIAILLLIGLEPSVSHGTRLHVSHTLHQVCQSVGEDSHVKIEVENAICNMFLRLVQPFSPQNKLFTLDLLAGSSGRTARVARSVAHSMLTDKSALLSCQYSALPPLSDLLTVLFTSSSSSSSRPAGKFEVHDATDYVNMASWTSILAVALTDIFQYVESGEANKITTLPSIRSPTKEKDGSIIHALHEKLYKIHNRIQDNRAAHLDRSRTKTLLFQIAFRVLYQCLAVTQSRKKNSQNIQSYFHRKLLPA